MADHGGFYIQAKEFVIYLVDKEDDWRFSSRQMNPSKSDWAKVNLAMIASREAIW